MTDIVNDIWFNNHKLLKYYKDRRQIYIINDADEIIERKCIDRIDIKCSLCGKIDNVGLYNINNFFNKKRICNTCNKIGKLNPFYGKTHSNELKLKLSNERKGKWCLGELNSFYGKKHTIDTRNKIKEKRKLQIITEETKEKLRKYRIEHPEFTAMISKKVSDNWNNKSEEEKNIIKEHLRQGALRAKQNPKYFEDKRKAAKKSILSQRTYKMNNFEKIIDKWLTDHNIEHNYSAIMSNGDKNLQFDFIIKDRRILIECQGTYWHSDPRFFDYSKIDKRQKEHIIKDKIKREFAKKHNYKLIEVWEYDIRKLNDFTILEKELLNENNNM